MTCERGSCQPDCAAGGVLGGARVNAVHAQDPSTALQVRDEVSFPLGSRMTKADASVLRSLPSKDNQHKKKSARSRKGLKKKKDSHTVQDELGTKWKVLFDCVHDTGNGLVCTRCTTPAIPKRSLTGDRFFVD